MTNKEIEDWSKCNIVRLSVTDCYYHHHAFEILNTHNDLRKDFISSLTSEIEIKPRIKDTRGIHSRGIEASTLNKEIRKLLKLIPNSEFKFEVNEEKGVFYFSSEKSTIGGFDFAILNHHKNLNALRNLCFGELHYHDGDFRWDSFLKKNPELLEISASLQRIEKRGIDINYESLQIENFTPLIVGEIQFGNWALAYRDFFKVLKANVQNSVDCLIYVVPTGMLETMLSDGIVTFEKTKRILQDFEKVISVPVWVVGLDIETVKPK